MNKKKMPTGYGMVQTAVMQLSNITMQAKAVYSLLASMTGGKEYCWPSVQKMAEYMGVSRQSITKYLNELEENGLIERSALSDHPMNHSNKYQIFYIDCKPEKIYDSKEEFTNTEKPALHSYNNNNKNNNNVNNTNVDVKSTSTQDTSKPIQSVKKERKSNLNSIEQYWHEQHLKHKKIAYPETGSIIKRDRGAAKEFDVFARYPEDIIKAKINEWFVLHAGREGKFYPAKLMTFYKNIDRVEIPKSNAEIIAGI